MVVSRCRKLTLSSSYRLLKLYYWMSHGSTSSSFFFLFLFKEANTTCLTLFPSYVQCITDLHRSQGINSSRDLPDNVLTFTRRHPLMATQVHPAGPRPLLFKRNVNYVKIAVHREPALDGNIYTVLFLGTGESAALVQIHSTKTQIHVV